MPEPPLELTFKSLYKDLLKDPDFKRWFDNIKRGSVSYAYESLRKGGISKNIPVPLAQVMHLDVKGAFLPSFF